MIARAQAAPRLRPRHADASSIPRNRKVLAYLREHEDETHPVRRQPLARGAGGRARPLRVQGRGAGRADRRRGLPADRRPALPADAAGLRLLLVPAAPKRPTRRAGTGRRPSRCRNSSPSSLRRTAGAHPRRPRPARARARRAAGLPAASSAGSPARTRAIARRRGRAARRASPASANRLLPSSTVDDRRAASRSATSCRCRCRGARSTCASARRALLHARQGAQRPGASARSSTRAYDERFVRDLVAAMRDGGDDPAADGGASASTRPRRFRRARRRRGEIHARRRRAEQHLDRSSATRAC